MSDELRATCLQHVTHHFCFITSLQISPGDLAELARPLAFALAALASAWVFYDARGRADFGAASVWAWALLTLVFPPAILPLYLAARLYTRRDTAKASPSEEETAGPSDEAGESSTTADEVEAAGSAGGPRALSEGREGESPITPTQDEEEAHAHAVSTPGGGRPARRRLLPALLYTAALVLVGAVYFYADYRGFEARVARAERAKLYRRPEAAINEYRAALRLREDGHTRKLLAVELLQAGRAEESLGELHAAARAGEPGEGLAFHVASAHVALGRRAEAADAYREFLGGRACAGPGADARCDIARAHLRALEGAAR
jgi:hypothetical protein